MKEQRTLSQRCAHLLDEIERLPASSEATNLSIICSELLRDIKLGDMPRGEWNSRERALLNLHPRIDVCGQQPETGANIPAMPIVTMAKGVRCRGCYGLGTACGKCESGLEQWIKMFGAMQQ